MTEPRKTLSLKPKAAPVATTPPTATTIQPVVVQVVGGSRTIAPTAAKSPAIPAIKAKPQPKATTPKKPAPQPKKPRVHVPRTRPAPTLVKAKALLDRLVVDHPVLFAMDGPATPWVVGIDHQIQHRYNVSNRVVKLSLSTWMATRGYAYRQAMEEGKPSMGLLIPVESPP